jgi:hypothetical protein
MKSVLGNDIALENLSHVSGRRMDFQNFSMNSQKESETENMYDDSS